MANEEHLARLRKGVKTWNAWREEHPDIVPDLSGAQLPSAFLRGADLTEAHLTGAHLIWARLTGAHLLRAHLAEANLGEADLSEADLTGANLERANLFGANLREANLSGANLTDTDLSGMDLSMLDLSGANLSRANLERVDLRGANLSGADLSEANLQSTVLVGTDFENANLTGCRVYGISAWDVKLKGATQRELVITAVDQRKTTVIGIGDNLVLTEVDQPKITVDNLEIAQFIYLLLHNEKIRNVIDTITSKVVLILGRFTPERKAVLDALREELRKRDYLPVLFDFDKPVSKDLTGTVSTLANMARFIIADLTDPSCIPHELAMVIPTTVVPLQPILLEGMREYAMFIDLKKRHHWVLEPYSYNTQEHLIAELTERVIGPAEAKVRELRG